MDYREPEVDHAVVERLTALALTSATRDYDRARIDSALLIELGPRVTSAIDTEAHWPEYTRDWLL